MEREPGEMHTAVSPACAKAETKISAHKVAGLEGAGCSFMGRIVM